MNIKDINESFITACMKCPQCRGWSDNQREIVRDKNVDVKNLHEKGIGDVLKYWMNRNTIG